MAEKKSTTGRPTYQIHVKLEDLAQAHYELIGRYISVLNEVSKMQSWFVIVDFFHSKHSVITALAAQAKPTRLNNFLGRMVKFQLQLPTLSYLVRLFVESHIKVKLNELSVAYLYLLQTIPEKNRANEKYRAWLKNASESCEMLSGTLNSLQSAKGLASTLWPLAVNATAALLGVSDLKDAFQVLHWSNILSLILFTAFPFVYFGLFMTTAFLHKRELFTIPFWHRHQLPTISSDPASVQVFIKETLYYENSIYKLENQIFNLLDRGKISEFQWDMLTLPLSLIGLFLTGIIDWLQNPNKPFDWIFAGVMFLGIAASISMGLQRIKMKAT